MLCKHREKTQFQYNADGIPEDSLPVNKHDSKERCPASIKEKELTLLCRETSEYFLPASSFLRL